MLKHADLTFKHLDKTIHELIQPLIYRDKAPLTVAAHHVLSEPVSPQEAFQAEYRPFAVGEKWGPPWCTTWFKMNGTIPKEWKGREVMALAALTEGGWEGFTAEGLVFMDGKPLCAINCFRSEIPLTPKAKGGEPFEFFLEAAANTKDEGQVRLLEPDSPPRFELKRAELARFDRAAWNLYHDARVCLAAIKALPEANPRRGRLLYALNDAINLFREEDPATWQAARDRLAAVMACKNGDTVHTISSAGHAHIDTAWLWPLRETMRKCARTFASAVHYMKDYPDYVFTAPQAVQYAWMKARYPSIWEDIKKAFKKGQWEPAGSMWVEADTNIPSGESLIRQILHGKRFFMREFDYETRDVWLPDVFGYTASFPQIMKKAGVDYFTTVKISWNRFNRFPHNTFLWEGIDGTRVFSHFPPSNSYNGRYEPNQLLGSVQRFQENDRALRSLYPYGYGDGGGGPSLQMLENAKRLKNFEGLPAVEQEKVIDFYRKAEEDAADPPVWAGELYLELHRGTYTTHARNKRGNRKSEILLHDAEFCDALDLTLFGPPKGPSITPHAPERAAYDVFEHPEGEARRGRAGALDRAWKLVLLNQFHDIIPGSSIHWVYQDCARDYATIKTLAEQSRDNALERLLDSVSTEDAEQPLFVLNTTGRFRAEVIDGADGHPLFAAVEPYGYAVLDSVKAAQLPENLDPVKLTEKDGEIILENGLVRVTIDGNGQLGSVYDLQERREALAPGEKGNKLQIHPDYPHNFEAWDVDIYYKETVEDITALNRMRAAENTPLRAAAEVERSFGKSKIKQKIVLRAGSRRIDFVTDIDWQERRRFLKAAFPVDVHSQRATYDIQFGPVERPTHYNTSWDLARFEVCAQKWAGLSESGYSAALLNDCKYGHDIHGNVMRVSLLRGPISPDPEADRGRHEFTYSFLPNREALPNSLVTGEAYALNHPILVKPLEKQKGSRPSRAGFFDAGKPSVIIETVKTAEDGDALILRLYESQGARGPCALTCRLPVKTACRTDLLERPGAPLEVKDGQISLYFKPFEIQTLQFTF